MSTITTINIAPLLNLRGLFVQYSLPSYPHEPPKNTFYVFLYALMILDIYIYLLIHESFLLT